MDAAVAIVVFVVFGGVGLMFSRREARRRREILQAVAARRQGHVDPGGLLTEPTLTIELPDVTLTAWMVSSKNNTATLWRAVLDQGRVPWFRITRRDFAGVIASVFGAQDIAFGYSEFDEETVVKAKDPRLVQRLWTEARGMEFLGSFGSCRVEDSNSILLERSRGFESAHDVEDGLDFLLALVRADVFGYAALRGLPGARDRGDFVDVEGPGDIRVGPETDEAGITRTVARARSVQLASATLPDEVEPLTKRIGGGRIDIQQGSVAVQWPTIETDHDRLVGAIELLRALARGPSLGVFR